MVVGMNLLNTYISICLSYPSDGQQMLMYDISSFLIKQDSNNLSSIEYSV